MIMFILADRSGLLSYQLIFSGPATQVRVRGYRVRAHKGYTPSNKENSPHNE